MEFSQLHFANPLFLWLGIIIPFIWTAYFLYYQVNLPLHRLEKFIDSHLLPHLLMNHTNKRKSPWKYLLLWSTVWAFLTLALAGPRWNFREIETFSKDQSLVILLDLSESMNVADVKPSRLIRAKQKIEDLLNLSKGVRIGLIAFAADPHMITPLTDDIETIRYLLPSLDTDLVYVQGSRLSPALEMASTMLAVEPGNNKAILIVSDGSFEDASALVAAKKIAEKGIVIHTMGVGTTEGAPIRDRGGNVLKKNGTPVLSKFEKEKFKELSKVGNGRYFEAQYSTHEEQLILQDLEAKAEAQMAVGKKNRFWEERFYLVILPVLPIILWWFRRGYVLATVLVLFFPLSDLRAHVADYFKNSEQEGKEAFENGDYEAAIQKFQDPFRKGVAYYRAGNFAEAEKMFRESSRRDWDFHAIYNLGNSLAQQQKYQEAIEAYEKVLEEYPEHTRAQDNLELVKKMLKEQEQSHSQNQDQEQKEKDPNKEGSHEGNQQEPEKPEEGENPPGNEQEGNEPEQLSETEQNEKPKEEAEQKEQEKNSSEAPQQPHNKQGVDISKEQLDQEADQWLNRLTNDPKPFMKNKFYIESKKSGTTEGIDPW